jgi:hypothetical protein
MMTEIPTPEDTRRDGIPFAPVRLADGRLWGFARPTTRLVPIIAEDEPGVGRTPPRITIHLDFGYSLAISRLVDALRIASRGDSATQQYQAFCSLAIALLKHVQDVERTTASDLLNLDSDALPGLVREILAIVSEEPPGLDFGNEVENGND